MGGAKSKQLTPDNHGDEGEQPIIDENQQPPLHEGHPDGQTNPNIINVAAVGGQQHDQNESQHIPDAQALPTGGRNTVTGPALQSNTTRPGRGFLGNSNGEDNDYMPTVGDDQQSHQTLVAQLQTLQEAYDNLMQVNEEMGGIQGDTDAQLERKDHEIQELKIKLSDATDRAGNHRPQSMDPGEGNVEMDHLHAQLLGLSEARNELENRCEELNNQKHQLEAMLEAKRAECKELMLRLSRMASDKLKDENPNIADLSDKNRPEKLAERFGELYCNAWTDVFEELTSDEYKMSEKKAIQLLLEFVKRIHDICHDLSSKQLAELRQQILLFTGHAVSGQSLKNRAELSTKPYKEERKKQYKWFMESIMNDVNQIKSELLPAKQMSTKNLQRYLTEATELCWLMSVQDPPVVLYLDGKKGGRFDKTYYTPYTNSGKKLYYIVWPAVLLCKEGAIIRKGVAEGKADKKYNSTKHNDDHSPEASMRTSLHSSRRSKEDVDD